MVSYEYKIVSSHCQQQKVHMCSCYQRGNMISMLLLWTCTWFKCTLRGNRLIADVVSEEQGGKVSRRALGVGAVGQLQSGTVMNIPSTACVSLSLWNNSVPLNSACLVKLLFPPSSLAVAWKQGDLPSHRPHISRADCRLLENKLMELSVSTTSHLIRLECRWAIDKLLFARRFTQR